MERMGRWRSFSSASDGGCHFDGSLHLTVMQQAFGLQVLGGLVPGRLELVQAAARAGILGRNHGPPKADLFESVSQAGAGGHVGFGGAVQFAGEGVHYLYTATIGTQVDMAAVHGQVLGGVTGSQGVGGRSQLEGIHDHGGDAGDAGGTVNGAPCASRISRARGNGNLTPLFDDIERGGVDAIDIGPGKHFQFETRIGDGFDGNRHVFSFRAKYKQVSRSPG